MKWFIVYGEAPLQQLNPQFFQLLPTDRKKETVYMVFICVVFATEAAGAKLTGHLKLPGDLTPFFMVVVSPWFVGLQSSDGMIYSTILHPLFCFSSHFFDNEVLPWCFCLMQFCCALSVFQESWWLTRPRQAACMLITWYVSSYCCWQSRAFYMYCILIYTYKWRQSLIDLFSPIANELVNSYRLILLSSGKR